MAVLKVIDRSGNEHVLEALEGWRVMHIIRDYGVEIEGICDGACDCATCHVIVAEGWSDKLPAAREDEASKLEELSVIYPTSRLSCQLIWQDAWDGLTVTVAPAE